MSGKRNRSKSVSVTSEDEDTSPKKFKNDSLSIDIFGHSSQLNKSRIYNFGCRKKPAELFRKDLISCMKLPDSEQLNRDDYLLITDSWKEEWEKGVQVPVNPESLPSPVFKSLRTAENENNCKMPKKLIKKNNSTNTDSQLSRYEVDLIDICWLNALKESDERICITDDVFEDIINELELQCATNMKAKQVGIEYDDHIICDICRSPDAEDGNEMVFCDSCNICVHQACYGIVSIPDGEWLCGPCKEYGSQTNVSCVLCPNTGGAFKPTTTTGQWAHVSCALWVPEVSIGCVSSMEPITKVKQIPASRWNLICSICNIKKGAPIQCTVKSCKASYHVTCAFNNKLKMKAVVDGDSNGVKLKSYCPKHSETEENIEKSQKQKGSNELNKNQREIEIATAIQTNDSNETDNNEFYKYVDISQIYHKFFPILQTKYPDSSQQTYQFYVDLILQYWKLKRVSNDGAPLIKITTTSSIEELQMKQRSEIMRLRVDLERIRNLSYMLCKREKLKRNWCRTHQSTVESALSYATGVTLTSTPNDLRQSHVNEEKLKLVKDIIDSSVIYDEKECDKHKPSLIVRRLKDLVKKDKLKRHRPNPYAKFYIPHGRRRSTEEEQNVNKPHVNGSYHKQPSLHNVNGLSKSQNLPLNNKTVPTNGLSRSISNGLGVNENSFKNVDKNKQTNRISMNSKCRIKVDDKNTTSPVLTRSSSLVGYKIPKKKREDSDNSPSKVNESKLRNELLSDIKLKSQPGNHVFANERRSAFGRYCSSALNASWKIVAGHDKLQKEFHLKLRNANNHQCSANTRTESGDEVAMIASAANDVDMRRENVLR